MAKETTVLVRKEKTAIEQRGDGKMPTNTAEETLGEFFGTIGLRNLIEKEPHAGYQVPLGPLITRASFWMFQVGSVLGRALRDRLAVVVKMIPMTADGPEPEQKVCDVLCKLATERVQAYGKQPTSLCDFWLKTEFDIDLKRMSVAGLKSMCLQRIPLEEVLAKHKLDEWLACGIGFGATYPELLEDLWAKTFEQVDEKGWAQARRYGLALPERPTPLPLKDTEADILADAATYIQKNFPELLDSLGVRERLVDDG